MIEHIAWRLFLVAAIVLCALATPCDAATPRIGVLSPGSPEGSERILAGFRQGLREHGYVDGTNIEIEYRFAGGDFDRLPALAKELIDAKVDVLVTQVTQASIAAKDGTRTIPIVMSGVSDPVASGLVASLSRPGGNVTGTSATGSDTAAKWLELLKEAVPATRRVAVLWNPANRVFQLQLLRETEAAARLLGIRLERFEARDLQSIEKALAVIAKDGFSGLNVLPDPTLAAHHPRIAALAERARLPSVSGSFGYADAGGLIAYGPSYPELARSAAGYVAKILRGAKPQDLPVEQPAKFELVVNLGTAKRIDVTIPQSLHLRATRVVE